MVDDRRSTPERDEACAVALFEARGKAGRIEDAIYERICELFGEDVIEDTSHDEYDMSIELYTKHDIVPTVDQITAITAMGFSCGWINFPDETQISFNRGQISKRHKRTYDKYPKNPRRVALSETEGRDSYKEAIAQNLKLRKALEQCVRVAESWHGDDAFDIYFNHAPEMKLIREALGKMPDPTEAA